MLHMASNKGLSPAMAQLSSCFFSPYFLQSRSPTTPPGPESRWFGLFPVRSPLLGESFLFSLPTGTKMFQFPAFASRNSGIVEVCSTGLSHSDIRGSKIICISPRLFAAYHVLHRLLVPRHSPYALSSLTYLLRFLKHFFVNFFLNCSLSVLIVFCFKLVLYFRILVLPCSIYFSMYCSYFVFTFIAKVWWR